MKALLLASAFALLLLAPSATAGPEPLHLSLSTIEIQNPVEQWTPWVNSPSCTNRCPYPDDHSQWVVNPTGCAWDVDDHWHYFDTDGYIGGGGSFSFQTCQITEQSTIYHCTYGSCAWIGDGPREYAVDLFAPSPGLTVNVCYQPTGRCFALAPAWRPDMKRYEYHLCAGVRWDNNDPNLQPIAGSNGGYGVPTTQTLTVANQTRNTVRHLDAVVAMVGWGQHDAGCNDNNWQPVFEYPFFWSTASV